MAIKLGLIGKDIAHSKSPLIYSDLIKDKICYELIDVENEEKLPDIKQLQKSFKGINITGPYKEFYVDQVDKNCTQDVTQSINCIHFCENSIHAISTDYLACKQIIEGSFSQIDLSNVAILGNGAMADLVASVLSELEINFVKFSRSLGHNMNFIDFSTAQAFGPKGHQRLVINCCSREFEFRGKLDKKTLFWDLNYNHPNKSAISKYPDVRYIDGMNLLLLQAQKNLSFWGLN